MIPDSGDMLSSNGHIQPDLVRKVTEAVKTQMDRTAFAGGIRNGRLQPDLVKKYCVLNREASRLFRRKIDEVGLSVRACHSVLKIARTIADLEGASTIGEKILLEAVGYREYGDGDSYWPF